MGGKLRVLVRLAVTREVDLNDPFVTTKRNGTGLGLALVAKVIGDHGGVIEFESQKRRTVFRVFLPMADAVPSRAGASRGGQP